MAVHRKRAAGPGGCALAVALYALCTTAGCLGDGTGTPPDDPDGAVPTARLAVHLAASEPSEEGLALTEARVGISELRARNDRGGDFEPRMQDVGEAELTEGTTIDFGAVPPATYGRVTVRLEPGDWGPGLALRLADGEGGVRVVVREAVDVDARCETPVLLSPSSAATLELRLEVDDLWEALPEHPSDGEEIEIDAESDPEALDAVAEALRDAWSLECGAEESEGRTEALERDES